MKRETFLRKPWKLENESVKDVLRYYAVLWIRMVPKLFFGQVGSALGIGVPDPNLTFLTKLQYFFTWQNSFLITSEILT
jgi:hypothetical protein